MIQTPGSICVIRLSAIGDVCNAAASIQAIQRSFPKAKITWIIGATEYKLVEDLPNIEFIVFNKARGKAALKSLKEALSNRKFDVLLHMQLAMRANRIATIVSAKHKIGYDLARAKEGHSLVINKRIASLSPHSRKQHVLDSFMGFAMKLGVDKHTCYPPQWRIPIPDAANDFAVEQIPNNTKALVICPAASKLERCWAAQGYADVVHFVKRKGIDVILCGGPAKLDKTLANDIESRCRVPVKNLVGKTSVKELYALLKRALFVIAPDTGPLHMANAAGTPTIGLYAHSDPARTGPYNSQDLVVDHYTRHLQLQYGKRPNQVRWGKRVYGSDLMEGISSKEVYDKINQLILKLEL